MITAGIIAEYNPFHKGHQYHIEETRRKTMADYIVIVMSGDYVQRGEPAIVSKYFRTKLALEGGADLVLELPVHYATASAEYFAAAGVTLLHKLGCVDFLSFGSEWAKKEDFEPVADILLREPEAYKEHLRAALRKGKNFAAARYGALRQLLPDERQSELLLHPNHILGLEYIKAIRRLNSPICPVIVKRKGGGYHDISMRNSFPSASAVRRAMEEYKKERRKERDIAGLEDAVGQSGSELYGEYVSGNTVSWHDLIPYLDYRCLMQKEQLAKCFDVSQEMVSSLLRDYRPGSTIDKLVERCHGRNRTDAAIRRGLLHIVLGLKKESFLEDASAVEIPYARVLGFSGKAAPLMKRIRERGEICLLQKPVQGRKLCTISPIFRTLFEADVRCAELYEQISAKKSERKPLSEWRRQQIIKEEGKTKNF
ncbi:MAG: nucleotidyltransferase family protein [Eubacteriales bacterium]|nr:nucleotidyltransferase family protein [Eubacteriales bacterium]